MVRYRRTQPGRLLRIVFGSLIVYVALLLRTQGPDDLAALFGALAVFTLLALVLALFHALTVTVTDEAVKVSYGVGLIRRRWKVRDIVEARAVRNRWYYGWGIRYFGLFERGPRGWLYNVAGLDAVEIGLADGRWRRIGTDDPAGLLRAVKGAAGLAG